MDATQAVEAAQRALTFTSPLFVLAVLAMALIALLAVLVYRHSIAKSATDDPDIGVLLTNSTLLFVGALIVVVTGIIIVEIVQAGSASTASWGALMSLIGWATAKLSDVFNFRFGSTKASAAKDETISAQAATIARTGTGDGGGARP